LQSAIISRLKVMAHMDIAERRLPQDGRMNLQANNQNIDVRVSTIPTVNGESISLRLLSRSEQQFGFDRLDLSKKQETTIRSLLAQPNGIILLTGPTGCGKSTSLYCFLSSINSVQRRIITIEEPVEYRLPGVSQIDVKPEIDLTFAKGLRHILRQDPNVVMVGEIRDIETADIAIRAAMTGHLVFSTLHTNDAVGGITRLLDMEVEPFLLASVVKAFIAQRLVRTICPDCVQLVDYPREYLAQIGFPVKELGTRFRRGAGCDQCRQTGYQGRAAIYEICLVTEPLRKLIMRKCDGGELKQCAISEGMETLRQDGWRRVAQGKTTIEEVVRVTQTDEVMAETTEEAEPVVAAESAGEVLAEIEADKATMEWESPEDRTPAEIYVEEGGKVNVGDKLAFIDGDGEEAPKEEEKGKEEKAEKSEVEREKEEKAKPKKEEAKESQKKAEIAKKVEKQSKAEKKQEKKVSPAKGKKTSEKSALKIKKTEEARVKASPVARRIAAHLGVALASVKRTGRKRV
jgi:Tfp pilus assembly pilus retraction ATPase PilT